MSINIIIIEYENIFFHNEFSNETFVYDNINIPVFNNNNNKIFSLIKINLLLTICTIIISITTLFFIRTSLPPSNLSTSPRVATVIKQMPRATVSKQLLKQNKIKTINSNQLSLLKSFNEIVIKPFLKHLINSIILYGDINYQNTIFKTELEQQEIKRGSRSFTGTSNRLGTGFSRSETDFFGTYCDLSSPGVTFSSKDFHINTKLNADLYLLSTERFNIFNKLTLGVGAKEKINNYHFGLANNLSLEFPLFYSKLENINGFDLRFIHYFKQNKEQNHISLITNYFKVELIYNNIFALSLIPQKNFFGLSYNYLLHDGIQKDVQECAELIKKNL